jgi:SAM-dependent methyltransferase
MQARALLRRRWPGAYWRLRNGAAIAEWLVFRAKAALGFAADAYDEAFWNFHDAGDWDGFAAVVDRLAAPASVVDVGCGQGQFLAALLRRRPGLPHLGLDASPTALARAQARGLRVAPAPLASVRRTRQMNTATLVEGFDLAVCLETAEHLPPWCAGGLLDALTRARLVLFSAAHPLQGGTLHLNERPFEYWRSLFHSRGFDLDDRDATLREAVARLDLPWWYGSNIHLFRPFPDRLTASSNQVVCLENTARRTDPTRGTISP